jgi:hypothetical protein
VGCGLKGKLVRLLSLGVGRRFEPQRNTRACHKMMLSIVRRVASKRMDAVRAEAAKEALRLYASGQIGAALVPLQRAIDLGDLPSLSFMAMLLITGREGVAKDEERAFELAEEGARFGSQCCLFVLKLCNICRILKSCRETVTDPSVPQFQKMVRVFQLKRMLLELRTAWTRCRGASLPPPQDIP